MTMKDHRYQINQLLLSPVEVQVLQAYAAATHELICGAVFIVNLQLIDKREKIDSVFLGPSCTCVWMKTCPPASR